MPSSLRSQTPRKALSKSASGSSFDLGDPELDSVSSISGESEDQQHPQKAPSATTIPGMDISSEKQEKIRLKNERKHQRHKERKLKELRERCAGVLMQRKLEALVYQLTSMGFTSDRAAAALALHDGDVEKSIAFILDHNGGNMPKPLPLKLDISHELGKLAELEARGHPLPDVERALVACEGDFDAATRLLEENAGETKPGFKPGVGALPQPFPGVHDAPQAGQLYNPLAPPVARFDPMFEQQLFPHHHHHHHQQQQQQQQRDLVADWRSSNPGFRPGGAVGVQRSSSGITNFSGFKQPQEIFQQPVAHHHQHHHQQQQQQQSVFSQMHSSSPAPGSWNSFDTGNWDWSVASAPRVDYQAIDWSVGLPGKPMGLGAGAGVSFNSTSNSGRSLMMMRGNEFHGGGGGGAGSGGFREVVSQEWTSPFAGKDLFHHHPPLHSL